MIDAKGHLSSWALERVIDEDVSSAERSAARTHLQGCARCRREMASTRALFAELDRMPLPEPPPGFDLRILAAVFPQPSQAAVLIRRLSRAYGLVTAGVVTLGVIASLVFGPARVLGGIGTGLSRFLSGLLDGLDSTVVFGVSMIKATGELAPVADTAVVLLRSVETTARALDPQIQMVISLTVVLATLVLLWALSPQRARGGVPHASLSV